MGIRREPSFMLFGSGIDRYSWRGVRWFMLTYFGAFLVAAILAPLLYEWIQVKPTPADPESLVAYLQSKPLARYVDRIRTLGVVVSLVLMIRWCGLLGRFGFNWEKGGFRLLIRFFIMGLASMGLVVAFQLLMLNPVFRESISLNRFVETASAALISALILGWLEEAVFRGMVFRMFYTATTPHKAILFSSLLFAAVHFKGVPAEIGEPVGWYSGFQIAGFQSVSVLFTMNTLEFINLTLVGIILTIVFKRTGSLVGCMGLHAGWVMIRSLLGDWIVLKAGPTTQFWGTQRIVDGYACLIILVILTTGLYVEFRLHRQKGQLGMGSLA